MIRHRCKKCHAEHEYPDELAGELTRCKSCFARVRIKHAPVKPIGTGNHPAVPRGAAHQQGRPVGAAASTRPNPPDRAARQVAAGYPEPDHKPRPNRAAMWSKLSFVMNIIGIATTVAALIYGGTLTVTFVQKQIGGTRYVGGGGGGGGGMPVQVETSRPYDPMEPLRRVNEINRLNAENRARQQSQWDRRYNTNSPRPTVQRPYPTRTHGNLGGQPRGSHYTPPGAPPPSP